MLVALNVAVPISGSLLLMGDCCSRNWRGDTRSGGVSSSRLPLWQLRQHMAHFITNLQIYIQVDVIESNYAQLQQRIADAQDFMEAERAHNR